MGKISERDIEEMVLQKLEGESYSEIRSALSERGLSEEKIRSTIRLIDERVLKTAVEQGNRDKGKSWYRFGLSLAIVGLLVTIGSNMGWILTGIARWVLYFLFFAGILCMYYGRRLQHKQSKSPEIGPGRIREKRPYK